MDRRSLLTVGALGALAAAARAEAQSSSPTDDEAATIDITHVYMTDDGESHIETITIGGGLEAIPLESMTMNAYQPGNVDWHTAPGRVFAMNIRGDLEVEASDGTKRVVGAGDPVFLSDTEGKGHVTRLLSPVTFVFLSPPQDFDIRAWAGSA